MSGPENVPVIRAAGYTRVSTTRQALEGLSLDAQRQRVEEYAAAQKWELVEIYEERGVSGRKADRPQLTRLLADRARFDRLIVPKLDRLGRSAPAVYATIGKLREAGITLVSLNPAIDASTREGRFLLNSLIGIAEMESDLNSERVKETAEARVARGRDYGSRRPLYGYERGDDRILVPIPAQAVVVQRVFAEFLAGRAQREIERGLRDDGVPASAGGPWKPGTVSKMLRHVGYVGQVRGPSGEIYPGDHDAIIDSEAFARVQALLAANRRSGIRRATKSGHLLRGRMLTCGHCGAVMQARTERGRGFYVCATRKGLGGPSACPMPRVSREVVEEPLLAFFRDSILNLDQTRQQIEQAIARKVEETRTLRQQAEHEAARAEERLARVRRDYQDKRITPEDWAEQRDELTGERDAARAEANRLTGREAEAAAEVEQLGQEEQLLALLHDLRVNIIESVRDSEDSGGGEAVRAALSRLFERFVIGRVDEPWTVGDVGTPGVPSFVGGGHMIVPVPRPDAISGVAPAVVRLADGTLAEIDFPALRTTALPLADIVAFTSQKTTRPPRRTIRSSSYPPAQTFRARIR